MVHLGGYIYAAVAGQNPQGSSSQQKPTGMEQGNGNKFAECLRGPAKTILRRETTHERSDQRSDSLCVAVRV